MKRKAEEVVCEGKSKVWHGSAMLRCPIKYPGGTMEQNWSSGLRWGWRVTFPE
jgi:hypothetical protein